jgi:sugar lactone lactonase YvrE
MQLNSPWGVHVDINNTLYVVDRANHRVQKWLKGYSYGITVAGTSGIIGTNSSLLSSPTAITFDTDYYMYIMDAGNNRVQRFAPGSLIADTIVAMTFSSPRGMRLDSIGNLYVADQNNHRIVFYRCGKIYYSQ